MDYRDTPEMNDKLDDIAADLDPWAETFDVAAISYEPKGKRPGWIVMAVSRDGRVTFSDYLLRREARQRLQVTAAIVGEKVQRRRKGPFEFVVDEANRKPRRPLIPVDLRWKVLERDGRRCRYCGANSPETILHIDHVIPVSRGGATTEANLVTSCRDCNLGKSNREL